MFGSIPKKLHVPRTSHLLMIKVVKPKAPRIPRWPSHGLPYKVVAQFVSFGLELQWPYYRIWFFQKNALVWWLIPWIFPSYSHGPMNDYSYGPSYTSYGRTKKSPHKNGVRVSSHGNIHYQPLFITIQPL